MTWPRRQVAAFGPPRNPGQRIEGPDGYAGIMLTACGVAAGVAVRRADHAGFAYAMTLAGIVGQLHPDACPAVPTTWHL